MISKIVAHHHCPIHCGDFNCLMYSVLDRHSGSRVTYCTTSVVATHKLVNDFGLDDVYRNGHPSTPGYTWMQAHNNVAERIDMFLVAKQLSHLVTEVDHHLSLFSDHHSVRLSLQCQDGSEGRGRSYWKFNLAFLSEDSFRTQFVSFWEYWQHQKSRFSRLLDWWDGEKARIRAFSISYGINRQRCLQRTEVKLQGSLDRDVCSKVT